jgi:hypothetical protein
MKQLAIGLMSIIVLLAILIQPARAQSMDITLAPHGSKMIENNFSFSLDANCIVHAKDAGKNKIRLHVLEHQGAVNGQKLDKGQSTSVVIQGQKSLSVHAEPGSKVNIQNLSDSPLEATCSV